jgi:hypothetical protein
MGSSTIGSAPGDEVFAVTVCNNTCSGDEEKVAELPEPEAPPTEKVAVRRALSHLSLSRKDYLTFDILRLIHHSVIDADDAR